MQQHKREEDRRDTSCLICRLIQGELPMYLVYEDPSFVVMLDVHPVNPGHLLVAPKMHVENFYDVEDALYIPMMLLVKRMSRAIKAVFAPLQVVMATSGVGNRHVHVHVMPVYGLYDVVPKEVIERQEAYTPPNEELVKVAREFAAYLTAQGS